MKKILHVGCCREPLPSFYPSSEWYEVRVDADIKESIIDVAADVRILPFFNNCFDGIFASHLLEHFDSRERHPLLEEWKRVLIPGGFIYIVVPNIAAKEVIQALTENSPDKVIYTNNSGISITANQLLYGQYYPGQYEIHRWGYAPQTLKEFLLKYLVNIQVVDQGLQICAVGYKKV